MNCHSILIVEDDDEIRNLLRQAVEMEGYDAATASNGKEGLDALSRTKPCLILLDLMMPVMDGWAFARSVEADAALAQIPIVVVTAYANKVQSIKAKSILKKPVDLGCLFKTIREYCE